MSNTTKALAAVLAVIVLVGGGYRWGASATNNERDAADLVKERAAAEKVEAEARRGQQASGALQLDLRDLSNDYQQLDKAFNVYKKRYPILARRPAAALTPSAPASPEGTGCSTPDVGVPSLSNGALWMWNSALDGTDRPAGSCGLAGQSDEACTADSGVTLEDAWDNQYINAKQCAEDRKRHQHLIDFINGAPH